MMIVLFIILGLCLLGLAGMLPWWLLIPGWVCCAIVRSKNSR